MSSNEPHEDEVNLSDSIEHVPNIPRKQNEKNVTQMSVYVISHTQLSSGRDESITLIILITIVVFIFTRPFTVLLLR